MEQETEDGGKESGESLGVSLEKEWGEGDPGTGSHGDIRKGLRFLAMPRVKVNPAFAFRVKADLAFGVGILDGREGNLRPSGA